MTAATKMLCSQRLLTRRANNAPTKLGALKISPAATRQGLQVKTSVATNEEKMFRTFVNATASMEVS
jgi:hypothetical protein